MKINTRNINLFSYIYITIPLLIFFVGWLNPIFISFSLLSLFFIFKKIYRGMYSRTIDINGLLLIFAVIFSLLWCTSCGIGGMAYQTSDWHMRNAIFRDLISYSYPVIYDNGSGLVYYIATFLPGALFGKMFYLFGTNLSTAFCIGNIFNLLYCTIGIVLVYIHIFIYTKSYKAKDFWIILLVIFFSGLDIFIPNTQIDLFNHMEQHALFQYSSNTTLIGWVYNQTIIPWLITMIYVNGQKKIENYGFLAIVMLFTAPLPFIGFAAYLIIATICDFFKRIKTRYIKSIVKKIFSLQNVLSILVLFPFIYLYYKSNTTVGKEAIHLITDAHNIYLSFFFLEAGLYLLIIRQKYSKKLLYNVTVISLLLIPFFRIGYQDDFCRRVSIPALLILNTLIIDYIKNNIHNIFSKVLLVSCLFIGAFIPFSELYQAIYYAVKNPNDLIADRIYTLNNKINENSYWQVVAEGTRKSEGNYSNYGCTKAKSQIFFKYFAK